MHDYTFQGAEPTAPRSVAVYHLYNDTEALLYVGITRDPQRRFAQHVEDKRWWWEVASWEIDWYPTRADAIEVEAWAIQHRHPAYNIAGAPEEMPESALVRRWGQEPRPKRATLDGLNITYVYMEQARSLRPDARSFFDADQIREIYEYMADKIGERDFRKHLDFVRTWNLRRLNRCRARDDRRRLEDMAAELSDSKNVAGDAPRPCSTKADAPRSQARARRKPAREKRHWAEPPPVGTRDLLADVDEALDGEVYLNAVNVVARMQALTEFRHPPYQQLNGEALAATLRKMGVTVTKRNGWTVVHTARIKDALVDRQRTTDDEATAALTGAANGG